MKKILLLLLFVSSLGFSQQIGDPISDVSIGAWTDEVGGTTDLYLVLVNISTSDFIEDLANNTTYQCTITSLTDPVSSVDHIIHFTMRGEGTGAPERCEVQLWQGTSFQIATTGNQTSRGSWLAKNYTLIAAEADAITDYTDLRFRVISSNLGGGENMRVAWLELEVPEFVGATRNRVLIIN